MADLQKGNPSVGTVILALGLAVAVGIVCSTLKGGQDGCEARGGKPHGIECEEGDE
jgi:hypothetical protein